MLTIVRRFAQSDALWAGLVRGVYEKVEQRIAFGKLDKSNTRIVDGRDFKRKWRVKQAKKQLVERFGLPHIRRVAAYSVVLVLAIIALIVIEATRTTDIFTGIYRSVISSVDAALAAIAGFLGIVALIVPSFKLAFASNQESSVSRGEVIFKQASSVKDELGFLEKVKQELQDLFDFLRDFNKIVGTNIVIVPVIDDLDRCITEGRNVKVLEAMQLILSVPGAPILSFLAVDSRIVVASIEDYYEKVFAKTNISGHEYLDKIVQLPFALPEPAPEKVERLMSKTLEGESASPAQVAQRLKVFGTHGRQLLEAFLRHGSKPAKQAAGEGEQAVGSKPVTFKVAPTKVVSGMKLASEGIVVDLKLLVQAIERIPLSEDGTKRSLELVCAAAGKLGPYLSKLAEQQHQRESKGVVDQEAVEILCRETNAALENGNMGFEEVFEACRAES